MKSFRSPAAIALLYAGFGAAWIAFSGYVLTVGTNDPLILERIELAKGLGFVLVTSVLLYLLLRSQQFRPADAALASGRTVDRWFLPTVILMAFLVIPSVGIVVYVVQAREAVTSGQGSLAAIVDLKARQIEGWLAERHGDGVELAANVGFTRLVQDLQVAEDPAKQARVQNRLQALRETNGYESVRLFDARGRQMHAAGEADREPSPVVQQAIAAHESGGIRMLMPYRDPAGQLHLEFAVPLVLEGSGDRERVGLVVLDAHPEKFLFPMLQFWPWVSDSAESNLVRRDGEWVEFLNKRRFAKDIPAAARHSAGDSRLIAAMAIESGEGGAGRGVDYLGHDVLGAWRPVGGTDWRIAAKIDFAEAMRGPRETAIWVTAITLLAVAVVSGVLAAYIRESQRARSLAAQAESDRLLRYFYELPFVGMAITSPATKRWTRFNDRLCEILGYPREELVQKTWTELTHPEDLGKDVAQFECVLRGESEGYTMQKRFLRKDGTVVHGEIDVKCVRLADGSVDYFVATVQDVTARVQAEAELHAADERHRLLFGRSLDAILLTQPDGSILAANEAACRMFQRTEAEILAAGRAVLVDPADPRLAQAIAIRDRTGEFSGELTMVRADGTKFPAEISSAVFKDSAGNIANSLIVRDASERKKAEAQLREQLDELRRWADVTVDREDRIVEMKQEVNDLLRAAGEPPRYASLASSGKEGA